MLVKEKGIYLWSSDGGDDVGDAGGDIEDRWRGRVGARTEWRDARGHVTGTGIWTCMQIFCASESCLISNWPSALRARDHFV